jgi:hypothetical protein
MRREEGEGGLERGGDERLTKCGFQSIAFLRGAPNARRALTLAFGVLGRKWPFARRDESATCWGTRQCEGGGESRRGQRCGEHIVARRRWLTIHRLVDCYQ